MCVFPLPGLKRFCTMDVTLPADPIEPLPKIGVIFRGTDRLWKKERHMYHPETEVFFNKCAWATREYQLQYCDRIWQPHMLSRQESWMKADGRCDALMFQDSFAQSLDHCLLRTFLSHLGAVVVCRR